ncbi:MAG: hypothetical protein LBR92_03300 [Puniceicoccales bacterium]|jgi:hypothetical protein|nr:hypothetical protein [Puniceicoccales bacterium]
MKAIKIGVLFSLLGLANHVPATQWFKWNSGQSRNNGLAYPNTQSWSEDAKEYFNERWELLRKGEEGDSLGINRLDFVKSVAWIFQDQATDKYGLVEILCRQFQIPFGSIAHIELIAYCLSNPFFRDTPILVLDLPDDSYNNVLATRNPCTDPGPGFCRAVMAADTIEEIAEIFDHLDDRPGFPEEQLAVYGEARLLKLDVARGTLKLIIDEKEFLFPKEILKDSMGKIKSTQEIFQGIVDYLQIPEEEEGAGLDGANAFLFLKQMVLAFRGQNGVMDGVVLVGTPLLNISSGMLHVEFDGVKTSLKFINHNGQCILVVKTEYSSFKRVLHIFSGGSEVIASEVRFKFPGDREVRDSFPILSVRLFPFRQEGEGNETIQWYSQLREDPPRKIIFYGGCRLLSEEDRLLKDSCKF